VNSVLDTYLGWEQPRHMDGCKRPAWEVGIRAESRVLRPREFGESPLSHSCPDGDCGHGNTFEQTMVRLVCRSCGAAHVVTGEATADTGQAITSTKTLGYGMPPRRVAGLLLWPGQPWLPYGRALDEEPHDFVVTRGDAEAVTEDSTVGQIIQGRGGRGGVVWTALAVADASGQFGYGQRLRFRYDNDGRGRGGRPLRTVGTAARWIAAHLGEQSAAAGGAA
jgi:hypothetical protein